MEEAERAALLGEGTVEEMEADRKEVYASSPDDGGRTDRFAFQLPFAEGAGDGARLDFVVRYETPEGIFWANNHGRNYTVLLRISPAPSPTDAEGLPQQQQLPQLEPQPESQGTMEAEARQLKSCMKPVRRRPNEEELRMKSSDDNTPAVADHLDVQESVGPLVAPTPLRPWPQMTHQVSEVTVTGRLTEEGDIPRNSASVAFTEVHQTPAIRIPPSSFLCGLGGSPRDQASGPDASEGAAGPLLEPSQPQVEAAWEVSSENGGGRKEPMVGAIMDEPPRGLEAMSGLEELLSEDSIDQELEQLYLSHLSRLRAAVAAGGAGNGGEGSTDGGVSPNHPLGIFTDRDLILKWPGPERALNSALAEEITLHYARLGRGVELIKDTEDPDEEGEGEEGLSTIPSSPEGGTPKESPPEILSGARSVVATMGDVWLPWAGGLACDSPVVLGPEGQFNGAPEKGMRKDTDSLHTNRVISGAPGSPGGTEARMESTEWADSLVPVSGKEPAVSGPPGQNLTLLGISGAEICPSSLARCHLWGPLTQTLGVLAGLVVVPVALNSGMSLLVLALCLSLVWFS
ncbi:Protein phosphatase 1 regulatory subunit 3F [Myotis brandtii]|uniref:Protein phosphatase 1 regulatory subunit 3F n=1 Tax=Myotis brandtii TaxID=109478 RepID=S7MTN5_MYOBR|nr:Protein phosphatase 1 regulatory subunit 3F [Myotis brandtii]